MVTLVLPLVFPAHDAGAKVVSTSITPVATYVGMTSDIVTVAEPQLKIEVTDSVYSERVKTHRKVATTRVVVTTQPVAELSLAEKREWAQKAASALNIDWKVLEAVWQVESGKRMKTAVISSAGAKGPCQFMNGTWSKYAHDGNGDGVKDVTDARDCLYGAAKLLASNGAASGDVTRALLSYNHSMAYVQKVLRIANSI